MGKEKMNKYKAFKSGTLEIVGSGSDSCFIFYSNTWHYSRCNSRLVSGSLNLSKN